MSYDNEELKPLSFDDNNDGLAPLSFEPREGKLAPLSFEQKKEPPSDHIPLVIGATNEVKNKDSNFVFFFGTGASGKSVILSSMLYYLSSQVGVLRPRLGTSNDLEAQVLLSDFFENMRQGILPSRSSRDKVIRMDLVFEPNNRSQKVPPINLTFLETSGENHNEIRRGGRYHSSIDLYLSGNIPLTFIVVTSYDTAHRDDALIYAFLDELERKGKSLKSVNLILVVSKWDKSGRIDVDNAEEFESFVNDRLSMTSQRINTYGLSKTFYTIGTIEKRDSDQEKITRLSLATAEVLSKWLYRSIVGYDLDYEGTFWERIKFSFQR